MTRRLRVPCTYQGGKQRVAGQIVEVLLEAASSPSTKFYDLCCGSGAISVELVNRGIDPSRIVMVDLSSWGVFWSAIGSGKFDLGVFERILEEIPEDNREIKRHMSELSDRPVGKFEAEIYPVLQACAFGGKQIWRNDEKWENAFFRDFWQPTANSIRRSPANPMQPSASELGNRVRLIAEQMQGLEGIARDINCILETVVPEDAVVYVDPPYAGTTGYGFDLDLKSFVNDFQSHTRANLFVSEGSPLSGRATMLQFGGANGGISGKRVSKHEEWLSRF
jgi:site-specific DNA-adenine methylase